jgi:hypothetical protein
MEILLAVTIASLALALVMCIVTWRVLRLERDRTAARVELLAALAASADSSTSGDDGIAAGDAIDSDELPGEPEWDAPIRPVLSEGLFESTQAAGTAGRRWLAASAVALSIAAVFVVRWAVHSPEISAAAAASRLGAIVHRTEGTPLELLSLRHAWTSDGALSITGLVQNPADGRDRDQVEAMVYLFDQQGRFFASGHAPLDVSRLAHGDESPFQVRIPDARGVSRYRVAFRSTGGGPLAHIDRRGQMPHGTTGGTFVDDVPLAAPAVAARPDADGADALR